mgnify:FL=1
MNRKTVSIILSAALAVSTLTMPLPWNQYTVKAEELNFKENGYDTPEETALAFVDAMKNKDIEQMLNLFAIESYVQHYNIPASLNSDLYSISTSLLPMDDNTFAQNMNLVQRKCDIFFSMRCLYLSLSSCFDSNVISFDMIENETSEDIINDFSKIKNEDDIFNIEATGIQDIHELYDKRSVSNTTYDDFINTYKQEHQEEYGYDDWMPVIVQCNWNNLPIFLCMEVAKYEDTWLILTLGGLPISILGYPFRQVITPACLSEDEDAQTLFSTDLTEMLDEITQKESTEDYETEETVHEGYDTPEEAINVFFENIKQNDLENTLSSMGPTLQYQNIDLKQEIERSRLYQVVLNNKIPLSGKVVNLLNQEQTKSKNIYDIRNCYLSLVSDGVDYNTNTGYGISDSEAFTNSLKGSDCSDLQYGNITEISDIQSLDKNKSNYSDQIIPDELKTFSVDIKLGEHSATDNVQCSCYNGQWVVTLFYPQK